MDVKKMKLPDLKRELEEKGVSTRGLKSDLVARLKQERVSCSLVCTKILAQGSISLPCCESNLMSTCLYSRKGISAAEEVHLHDSRVMLPKWMIHKYEIAHQANERSWAHVPKQAKTTKKQARNNQEEVVVPEEGWGVKGGAAEDREGQRKRSWLREEMSVVVKKEEREERVERGEEVDLQGGG